MFVSSRSTEKTQGGTFFASDRRTEGNFNLFFLYASSSDTLRRGVKKINLQSLFLPALPAPVALAQEETARPLPAPPETSVERKRQALAAFLAQTPLSMEEDPTEFLRKLRETESQLYRELYGPSASGD